jgi:hypothetical protein
MQQPAVAIAEEPQREFEAVRLAVSQEIDEESNDGDTGDFAHIEKQSRAAQPLGKEVAALGRPSSTRTTANVRWSNSPGTTLQGAGNGQRFLPAARRVAE